MALIGKIKYRKQSIYEEKRRERIIVRGRVE